MKTVCAILIAVILLMAWHNHKTQKAVNEPEVKPVLTKLNDSVDTPVIPKTLKKRIVQAVNDAKSARITNQGITNYGAETLTIKVRDTGYAVSGAVMILVKKIIRNQTVGDGAEFYVALPHKAFLSRVKCGHRIQMQVSQQTYFLDLISVSGDSAKFQVIKGADNESDES